MDGHLVLLKKMVVLRSARFVHMHTSIKTSWNIQQCHPTTNVLRCGQAFWLLEMFFGCLFCYIWLRTERVIFVLSTFCTMMLIFCFDDLWQCWLCNGHFYKNLILKRIEVILRDIPSPWIYPIPLEGTTELSRYWI